MPQRVFLQTILGGKSNESASLVIETNRPLESIRLHESDFITLHCNWVQIARETEPDVMWGGGEKRRFPLEKRREKKGKEERKKVTELSSFRQPGAIFPL